MNNPTFKEIEHKVNLILCLVALAIALGLAFSSFASAESKVKNEFKILKNDIEGEFKAAKSSVDTFISTAVNKYIITAKTLEHAAPSKTTALQTITRENNVPAKMVGEAKAKSDSRANSTDLQSKKNNKIKQINTMPVMDELAPAFKKTRFI
ncbi:MAG: hypothetical protein PSV17_01350 [Methylotenera sp.]|uniref:hypothetical protein n=1 Tax=Methylotenera sp. TaxID=2051956 RepID=UPI00248A56BA|nr:hypothetical protein [Methylotenera sp.]MDI1308065.1 hypothetical protein [Methylotenera sp.]